MAIRYTHKEELWNSWSHAGGIVMGVVFGVIFIVMAFKGDNPWARLGVCLYLFGMLGSYVASTIYHALPRRSKWKERLRKWDHAAIYWHIAGSYSPLTLVALRTQGYWGWTLFCFVWLCAIVGTTISFIRLKEHSNVETFCFVGMGLCVLVALKPLIDSVSTAAFIWIVAEGVAYPFLCPVRLVMPYYCRLGRSDGVYIIRCRENLYKIFNKIICCLVNID